MTSNTWSADRYHPNRSATSVQTSRNSLSVRKRADSLAYLDLEPPHRQPLAGRVVLATLASIVGSLAADAILVVIGEAIFPATKGYVHFRFSDYAKLTVIGVIIACVAWPVVTRVSATSLVAVLPLGHPGHAFPVAPRPVHPPPRSRREKLAGLIRAEVPHLNSDDVDRLVDAVFRLGR